MSTHIVNVTIAFDGYTEQEDAEQALYELLSDAVKDPKWRGHGTTHLVVGRDKEVTP